VLAPTGIFLIGMVELKSNVTLHLAAGAKLLGSADGKQYRHVDAIPLNAGSTMDDGNTGLLFAVNARNIAIEGMGTIDGQGAQFRSPGPGVPAPAGIDGALRPYHLLFYHCENLRVQDVFLTAGAYHSVRVCMCKFVRMDGLRIHNRVNGNNDGFHFISCQYVHVGHCDLQCGDDACALFGSCKFVTVSDCSFSTRWSIFRFGGGESENITVSNCVIYDTFGCPIKMQVDAKTRLENILFSNIVMNNVTGPIYIGLGSAPRKGQVWWNWNASDPASKAAPGGVVRNISFQNIQASIAPAPDLKEYPWEKPFPGETRTCINLSAADGQYIEGVRFSNVHITFPGGGTSAEAANRQVAQMSGSEYFQFGVLPAYALYARNVRGLRLDDVRFDLASADHRPALVFDHVEDAAVNGLSAHGNVGSESLLRFADTRQTLLTACRVLTPCKTFLAVEGHSSEGIAIAASDLSRAAAPLAFSGGAKKEDVRLGV
jgi:polygalacturonase